jgi:DNA-binding NarL/FixJ family response regulator
MRADAIRIVVGAADYLAQEGIVWALERSPDTEVTAVCSSIDELRELVERDEPDVVVTTLQLAPGYVDEGVAYATELDDSGREIGVVVLGERGDAPLALRLFEGAASGRAYLLRERIRTAEELLRAIREVARGGSLVDPVAAGRLLRSAARRRDARSRTLTAREREVLALLADAESNTAIGQDLGISTRAVERHVNSIFRKLDLPDSGNVNRRVKAALVFAGISKDK